MVPFLTEGFKLASLQSLTTLINESSSTATISLRCGFDVWFDICHWFINAIILFLNPFSNVRAQFFFFEMFFFFSPCFWARICLAQWMVCSHVDFLPHLTPYLTISLLSSVKNFQRLRKWEGKRKKKPEGSLWESSLRFHHTLVFVFDLNPPVTWRESPFFFVIFLLCSTKTRLISLEAGR